MALFALAWFLGWNYREHKHGRATACSITRIVIPEALFVIAFRAGADILETHVVSGYPRHRT